MAEMLDQHERDDDAHEVERIQQWNEEGENN
jgi:hypothetical protein